VYETNVFASDKDQWLVAVLLLVCLALGGTALTGIWAVRREDARVMRMVCAAPQLQSWTRLPLHVSNQPCLQHFFGELVILGTLFLIGCLATYYKNQIPAHLKKTYEDNT
jgi:hypothetical protein